MLRSEVRPVAAKRSLFKYWLVPLALVGVCLGIVSGARAATETWSGLGANNTWTNPANWGGAAPVNGDDLVFNGSTRLNNSNNITGLRPNSITYNSTGFTNNGLAITITNGIVDNVGNNTNIISMTLGASQSFANLAAGTALVLNGTINTTNYNLSIGGDGNVFLGGAISGIGGVTMNGNGVLRLGAANTFSNANGLTINSGTVRLGNAAAIPSGNGFGNLNMVGSAVLDLGGNSQTINGLSGAGTVDEASTNAATYTLTVGNANSNAVFSGTIQNTFGIVALTKTGTGTQTLSGASSYVGPTTISQGTLLLAAGGSIAATNLTIAPGGVFDITGAGGFTLNGNLIAGRTSAFTNDIYGNLTMNSGNITPVPGSAGTLTINGNLTLTGGTLNYDLKDVATMGGGTNDLIAVNGGTLDVSGGTTAIKLNPIAGSLNGTYTLISSPNSVVGTAANFSFDAPRGLTASFDTTTQPSNVLMTANGSPNPASLVWAGNGGGGNWDVQLSQNWLSNAAPDVFYNLDTVTFNDSAGSANATVSLPGAVSPGSVTVSNSGFTYNLGLSSDPGLISGTGGLTKNGSGMAILNTANNYSGTTVVNGGALVLGVSSANPNFILYNSVAPGNLVLGGGGVFMADNANITYRDNFNNLTINPGGSSVAMRNRASSSSYIFQCGNVIRNVGGTIDFANIQQKANSPQVGLLITNTTTANGILGGFATIFETDWVVPVATGLGSIPYAAYQTNLNPATWGVVSNVTLTANPSANVNNTTINSLKMSGSTVTINSGQSLSLTTGGLLVPNAGTASAINGGTLLGATNADLIVFEHSAVGSLTIGSVIADNTNNAAAGGSALTKSGQGTLILTGNNTYSGPTYINGSTLTGNGNANTPATIAAGTLQIGGGSTSGGISNTPSVANNGTLAFNRSDTVGYSAVISGIGGVKQLGSGITVLTADNTYSGLTTISAGTLQIGGGGSTGSFNNSAGVANSGTLLINRTGTLSYSGVISGSGGALTIQGGGTLILNANNTYSGNTTISQSTLVLGPSGSISNSPVITLGSTFDVSAVAGFTLNAANGQQLVGSGVVTGNVATASSTKIVPAGVGVIGSLSFSNNLTLNGGTCVMDVSRPSNDQIIVRGDLTLTGGTIQINVVGAALTNGTYKLFRYSGLLNGGAANLAVSGFSQAGQLAGLSDATGGEIDLVITSGVGANLTWDGTGNVWDYLTADWTNAVGVQLTFHHGDNVRFDDSGVANPVIAIGAAVDPASVLINSASPYSFVGGSKITGGATVTKNNLNTLTVLTANDYSGPTTIAGGALQLGDGNTSGTLGSGNVTNNGALNFNEPADTTETGDISGTGTVTQEGMAGAVTLIGNNSYSGLTTINSGTTLQIGAGGSAGSLGTGNAQNDGALVFNRSGTLSYGGAISGAGSVSNIGPGTLTLSGVNTYTNNTVIANGRIKAGAAGALPNGAGAGNVVLDGGASAAGMLDLNGFNISIDGLAGLAGTVLGQVANNTGTATNTLTMGNGDATATFSGTIRDNNGSGGKITLIKTGTGTQTLDLPTSLGNLYSGGTILSNGVFAITSPGGNNPVNAGANSLALGSGPVTFYGGTLTPAGAIPQSTTPTWFPPLPNTFIVPAGQSGTVNGVQRGGINSALIGSGVFYYNPAYVRGEMGGDWSAFTGQIILTGAGNGGQMGLNLAAGFPNARVYMTTNVTLYGRLGGTPTIPIGELAGGDDSDSIVSTSPAGAGGQAANFMIGGLNTTTNFNGRILDSVGIIKVGTGSLTLTNVNMAYTGITTVSNGVLVFTGALPPSSRFNLASPGVLDISALSPLTVGSATAQTIQGNGTLLGSLVVGSSGSVLPGFTNGIGTLTVTNDVNLGGTAFMELNRANTGSTNDQIASQTITLGGTLNVTNLGPALKVGDTFKLFNATTISGSFATENLPATDATGYVYTWTNNLALNGTITVLTSVLPVNTTPTNITVTTMGNLLQLSWPLDRTGWQLQSNSVGLSSPSQWFMVPGSTATNIVTLPINPAAPRVFFRLAYP
jgi:autotransporter-associated beta strand protein